MKDRILIVTVGGSRDPVIIACRDLEPMFVAFIATKHTKHQDGSEFVIFHDGDSPRTSAAFPSRGSKKAIIKQLELRDDQYEVFLLESPDDLQEAYGVILKAVEKAKQRFPAAEIVIDMTAGTKSMSAAAAIVAYEEGLRLSVVQGTRSDLMKTWDDSFRSNQSLGNVTVNRELRKIQERIGSRNYREAVRLAEAALSDSSYLSPETRKQLMKLRNISRAFAFWDEFEHEQACNLLEPYGRELHPYISFATEIERAKTLFLKRYSGEPAEKKKVGYEIVYDIYLNALRRGEQRKFDDAVARLYRSLELKVQLLLLNYYDIRTDDVDLALIKDSLSQQDIDKLLHARNHTGKIQIGLTAAYDLLSKLDRRLSPILEQHRATMLSLLRSRNHSILAHGLNVVTEQEYRNFMEFVANFFKMINQTIRNQRGLEAFPQLPKEIGLNFQ